MKLKNNLVLFNSQPQEILYSNRVTFAELQATQSKSQIKEGR